MERKEETKAVKEALAKAGIKSRVGHGRGTAWGWLEINIGSNPHAHASEEYNHSRTDCLACMWHEQNHRLALSIAQDVTGRKGQYDGDILILAQGGVL
jgi:hypothetical protein